MKIGVGQINTRIGDFAGNAEKIVSACAKLGKDGAALAVFPECTVSGYPLKDLVFYEKFVEKAQETLAEIASKVEIPAIVGCPRRCEGGAVGFRNSAYLLRDGHATLIADKHLLPNYGALNDARNFDSGEDFGFFEMDGVKIGVCICEDIWSIAGDFEEKRYAGLSTPLEYFKSLNADGKKGLDLLVNISASVFSSANDSMRAHDGLLVKVSRYVKAPVLWCNLVGGADNIVFAGASTYADATLQPPRSVCLRKFEEDLKIVDTSDASPIFEGDGFCFDFERDVYAALVMATRDFVRKCGARRVLIGLSGGIDSAVVAALAVAALGRENVMGVSMPSKISSAHSVTDAELLAENLGIDFRKVPIAGIVESVEGALADVFRGRPRDVTEENIQSRARGLVLMAISNKFSSLVLTTGNKSECAVGYCTLYGDTCGAFAPICDVYKTDVYRLANIINRRAGFALIPQNTIDKPPSAELRPDQKDEDSLPPYDLFDAILRLHIDSYKSVSEIVSLGYDAEVVEKVAKLVARAEYKRTQYPIGPKISRVAYSCDRLVPVAAVRGIQ